MSHYRLLPGILISILTQKFLICWTDTCNAAAETRVIVLTPDSSTCVEDEQSSQLRLKHESLPVCLVLLLPAVNRPVL